MKHSLFSEFTVHMHLPKIPLIVTNAMIGRTFWVFLAGVPLMRTKTSLLRAYMYNVLLREYNFNFIVYIYTFGCCIVNCHCMGCNLRFFFSSVSAQLRFYFTCSITKAVINYSYKQIETKK